MNEGAKVPSTYSSRCFGRFCGCFAHGLALLFRLLLYCFVFLGKHFNTDASLELLGICCGSNDAQFKAVDTDLKLHSYLITAITKVP